MRFGCGAHEDPFAYVKPILGVFISDVVRFLEQATLVETVDFCGWEWAKFHKCPAEVMHHFFGVRGGDQIRAFAAQRRRFKATFLPSPPSVHAQGRWACLYRGGVVC